MLHALAAPDQSITQIYISTYKIYLETPRQPQACGILLVDPLRTVFMLVVKFCKERCIAVILDHYWYMQQNGHRLGHYKNVILLCLKLR